MKKDKKRIYYFELLLAVFLFFTLFASNIGNKKWLIAIFLLIYMTIIGFFLKRKAINSIYKKPTMFLMLLFGIIYLALFYLMGLYFGFEKTKYIFSLNSLLKNIIPIIIVIFASERIRSILLSQDGVLNIRNHKINISDFLVFISMVFVDLIIYTSIYDLSSLDDFLTAVGFVLYASLSNNLLYNYFTKRFGPKGIIIFRLITVLYVYIIPITPSVYLFLRTFLRMLYPFLIYLVLENTYSKVIVAVSYTDKKKNILWTSILFVIVTLMIMLISCEFRFGIVVVGSDSMTGSINRGDAIIYERLKSVDELKVGEVIIFKYNGIRTIHRIIEIKAVNGEYRYITKGDANKEADNDYRLLTDVEGLVKMKIRSIGKPTLWLRSRFNA